jgi:hypothetical protein
VVVPYALVQHVPLEAQATKTKKSGKEGSKACVVM